MDACLQGPNTIFLQVTAKCLASLICRAFPTFLQVTTNLLQHCPVEPFRWRYYPRLFFFIWRVLIRGLLLGLGLYVNGCGLIIIYIIVCCFFTNSFYYVLCIIDSTCICLHTYIFFSCVMYALLFHSLLQLLSLCGLFDWIVWSQEWPRSLLLIHGCCFCF